jgi:anaerobic ribonucleoside-triphosphate reductase activating protein
MSLLISLSRVLYPLTTLGPGRRLGIWFQGCSLRCAGCISVDTWASQTPQMTVAELLRQCAAELAAADGVTITGGEPFEQPAALTELLAGIRGSLRPGADVLVYSGFCSDKLQPQLAQLKGLIDVLCAGPFQLTASQTRPLMGSDNQELLLLTETGLRNFSAYLRVRNAADDVLDLMMDSDGTAWLAGIPKRGDLGRLQSILLERGFCSLTTEDGRSSA